MAYRKSDPKYCCIIASAAGPGHQPEQKEVCEVHAASSSLSTGIACESIQIKLCSTGLTTGSLLVTTMPTTPRCVKLCHGGSDGACMSAALSACGRLCGSSAMVCARVLSLCEDSGQAARMLMQRNYHVHLASRVCGIISGIPPQTYRSASMGAFGST
jgi:hypothetical protein